VGFRSLTLFCALVLLMQPGWAMVCLPNCQVPAKSGDHHQHAISHCERQVKVTAGESRTCLISTQLPSRLAEKTSVQVFVRAEVIPAAVIQNCAEVVSVTPKAASPPPRLQVLRI